MQRKTVVTVAITFAATTILGLGVIIGLYGYYCGNEPATLGSIDICDSLLDGFELVSSRPAFVGIDDVLNFQTLWYQTGLQPDLP